MSSPSRAVEFLGRQVPAPDLSWVPKPQLLTHKEVGAGGMRCFGRLALWSVPETHGGDLHFTQLQDKIKSAWARLDNRRDVNIVIVGSLAGGTGSGIFIDVAYLARFCIEPEHQQQPNVYGFFITPSSHGRPRLTANAYACLYDVHHYSQEDSRFEAKWPLPSLPPGGFRKGQSPFTLTTLMSPDWGGNEVVKYEHLLKLASVYLFVGSLGFNDHRGARIVDATNKGDSGSFSKYSMVSLAALTYPKLEIEEAAAVELSIDYLKKLSDPNHCFGHRISGMIDDQLNRAGNEPTPEVDAAILNAFAAMSQGGPDGNVEETLRMWVVAEEQGQFGDPERELIELFSPRDGANVFQFVKPRTNEAKRILIAEINRIVACAIEDSGSITYGRKILEHCLLYLRSSQKLWETHFKGREWEQRVHELIRWALHERCRYVVGERPRILFQRLLAVLELLKMHNLQKPLIELCEHIDEGGNSALAEAGLPSLPELDHLIRAIHCVSEGREDSMQATEGRSTKSGGLVLPRRLEKLKNRDETPKQIYEHYPKGSFDSEVSAAQSTFGQVADANADSVPESKRVFTYKGYLWEYLREQVRDSKLRGCLYYQSVASFMRRLRDKQCVGTFSMSEVVEARPKEVKQLADYASQTSVMLKRPIMSSIDYPKTLITSEEGMQGKVKGVLQDQNCENFTSDNPHAHYACSDLDNMLVFIDERSDNFEPLQDVSNIDAWGQRCMESDPNVIDAFGVLPFPTGAKHGGTGGGSSTVEGSDREPDDDGLKL